MSSRAQSTSSAAGSAGEVRFPIVLKTANVSEPEERVYYEVASNGIFQVRRTGLYRAVTRALAPVPGLAAESEHVVLACPTLRRAQLEEVLAFFDALNEACGAEGIVVLFVDVERNEFVIDAPPQTVDVRPRTDGSWLADLALRYRNLERPAGCVRFGTIHSHAELSATASRIDELDEAHEDGLHVVFGHFGAAELSISASFVAGGVRFAVDPAEVLEPCSVPQTAPRRDWIERVELVARVPHGWAQPPPSLLAGTRPAAAPAAGEPGGRDDSA